MKMSTQKCKHVVVTYNTVELHRPMKLSEKSTFDLAPIVVGRLVTLEDLVETFENECPELPKRSVIEDKVTSVSSIVVVWTYDTRPVDLPRTA